VSGLAKMAAGRCQDPQAGRLRYVAQAAFGLRVRGGSKPAVFPAAFAVGDIVKVRLAYQGHSKVAAKQPGALNFCGFLPKAAT